VLEIDADQGGRVQGQRNIPRTGAERSLRQRRTSR
jgi:hypothetical protein